MTRGSPVGMLTGSGYSLIPRDSRAAFHHLFEQARLHPDLDANEEDEEHLDGDIECASGCSEEPEDGSTINDTVPPAAVVALVDRKSLESECAIAVSFPSHPEVTFLSARHVERAHGPSAFDQATQRGRSELRGRGVPVRLCFRCILGHSSFGSTGPCCSTQSRLALRVRRGRAELDGRNFCGHPSNRACAPVTTTSSTRGGLETGRALPMHCI